MLSHAGVDGRFQNCSGEAERRLLVDSGLWRASAISAIPNARLVRTTERLAWIHRKQSLVEGNR